jgi:hypothetical protein
MMMVLASVKALDDIRAMGLHARALLRARRHPDGGVWVATKGPAGDRVLRELIERYGTRVWGERGWLVQKPQLRLRGLE